MYVHELGKGDKEINEVQTIIYAMNDASISESGLRIIFRYHTCKVSLT